MLLKNFPINAVPRGREQSNTYVKALDVKNEAEQVATAMINRDGYDSDLNKSDGIVVFSDKNFDTGANLRYADLTGVVAYEGSKEEPESLRLQVEIVPDKVKDRTLTIREDGDTVRYTRQFRSSEQVEHMVHDTATDTFNYFIRDTQGHFLPQS